MEVATSRMRDKAKRGSTIPSIPVRCRTCHLSFCPHCWEQFHHATTCDEAAAVVVGWQAFLDTHQVLKFSIDSTPYPNPNPNPKPNTNPNPNPNPTRS